MENQQDGLPKILSNESLFLALNKNNIYNKRVNFRRAAPLHSVFFWFTDILA